MRDGLAIVCNAGDSSVTTYSILASGELLASATYAVADHPSTHSMPAALSADGKFLSVALRSEPFQIATFSIDPRSKTLRLSSRIAVPGSIVYICPDATGRFLFFASTVSRFIAVSAVGVDGQPRPPHQVISGFGRIHAVQPDRTNEHLLATASDRRSVLVFHFDAAAGRVEPLPARELPVASAEFPRHFAFDGRGRFLYLLDERTGALFTLRYDGHSGSLATVNQVNSLPPCFNGQAMAADIGLTPDGRFLYSSERASSTLSAFSIDQETGTPSFLAHYRTEESPRSFKISPSGELLLAAGQASRGLAVYRIEPTGLLSLVGRHTTGGNPSWVEIASAPQASVG